ncbi:MAG: septum formation initiator [Sulfurospirillaceae bacterium]|nr:septum formation initiator [Sulfurospirillaceae bacterium]
MNKILHELGQGGRKRYGKLFYGKVLLLIVVVVFFGIYVGNVLFGKSSLEVLLDLQDSRDSLVQNVKLIKKQNALLQKEYFELKQLEPSN